MNKYSEVLEESAQFEQNDTWEGELLHQAARCVKNKLV